MPDRLWKKIEVGAVFGDYPLHLEANDSCYYAMDYLAGGGWNASEANGLINNFKKSVSKRGTNQWPHKLRAIERFGIGLARILPPNCVIAPLPTSKAINDPEYDDRLVQAVRAAAKYKTSLTVEQPIGLTDSISASHVGGSRRINDILANLVWNGFAGSVPDGMFLIDDVITTGAHFKACQRLIWQHHPAMKIGGIFWAKTMWPKSDDDSTTIN
jgi:hypothetical protein